MLTKIRKQTKIWHMGGGGNVRICDMEDRHLRNTLLFLKRWSEAKNGETRSTFLNWPSFLNPTGDMASEDFDKAFDGAMDSDWHDYAPDIFENLCLEAERRGFGEFLESNDLWYEDPDVLSYDHSECRRY